MIDKMMGEDSSTGMEMDVLKQLMGDMGGMDIDKLIELLESLKANKSVTIAVEKNGEGGSMSGEEEEEDEEAMRAKLAGIGR
jgi:hypothetical protein